MSPAIIIKPLLTVYYDGLCPLCSREINHYRKNRAAKRIDFIDITADSFNAAAAGVDPVLVHKNLHVKKADQSIVQGVDAFIAIWKTLPNYHWLAKFIGLPGIYSLACFGYFLFAKIRPYLPRRKMPQGDCSDSPFCDLPPRKI